MSSMSPVAGRLSQIFSPRSCIFVATIIFSLGTFITSRAVELPLFLVGRVVTGIGAAGILTLAIILVIELTSKKRRGLFIGLVNTGYTVGVSLGAVIAGALLAPLGWVRHAFLDSELLRILSSLASTFLDADTFIPCSWNLYLLQYPLNLHHQRKRPRKAVHPPKARPNRLRRRHPSREFSYPFNSLQKLTPPDILPRPPPLQSLRLTDNPPPYPPLLLPPPPLRPRRNLPNHHPHNPHNPPPLPRRTPHLSRATRPHDGPLERPLLHPRLRPRHPLLDPRYRRLDPNPYERWIRPRRVTGRLDPYPPRW